MTAFMLTAIFFINPFGLRTATVKYSEDIFIRLWAPLYGEKAESEIAVILLDDAFITHYENRYPVSYSQLVKLFRVISQHQPAAVFFDIFQQYEHSNGLKQWLNSLDNARFPVFMAGLPWVDTPQELSSVDSLRHKLNQVTQFTTVGWQGYEHYYPLQVNGPLDGSFSTAALDLYTVWCRNNQDSCPLKSAELEDSSLFKQPMLVQWSNRPAPDQETYLNLSRPCQDVSTDLWGYVLDWLTLEIRRLCPYFETAWDERRLTCSNILTLSASSLFEPGAMSPESKINKALQGRIILVGYNLQASNDRVFSPLHGSMPGVFYHAMALDNLINYGSQYWHVPQPFVGTLTISDLLEGVLQLFVFWLVFYCRGWHLSAASGNGEEHLQDKNLYVKKRRLLFITSLALFITSIWWCFFGSVGVINWFALLMTMGLLIPTLVMGALRKFSNKLRIRR